MQDLHITKVIPHKDLTLDVELSNNQHLMLNMTKLVNFPFYKKLMNLAFFMQVKYDDDIIFWNDDINMHIGQVLQFASNS